MYGDYGGKRGGPLEDIKRALFKGGIPVTLSLLAANILTFLLVAGLPRVGLWQYLVFDTRSWPQYFWTFLTWPLVGAGHPLNLVFAMGWFYTFGGSLERSWGSRVFGNCVLVTAALTSLTVWIGSFVAGTGMLVGLWVLSGAAAVAWALINRREVINFWMLPIPAPAFVFLGCIIAWYDAGAALIGVFALSGCAAAWWYVTQGRYGNYPGSGYSSGRGGQRRPGSGHDGPNLRFQNFEHETRDSGKRQSFNLARWWRERQEKKRLEAMFRRSGYTDPEERRKK
jgi:membrane associated rhomboid family serine protease